MRGLSPFRIFARPAGLFTVESFWDTGIMAMSEESFPFSSPAPSAHVLAFLFITLFGVLLYGHTLQAPFYMDDFINVKDSLYAIKSLSLHELVSALFNGLAQHRPLANLSFALNYYVHGFALPGYHLVNIVIHVINGLLLYVFVFKTITLPPLRHKCQRPADVAALASLLWFVNPVQIQSVTYIVQRMTSMATLFFLCSFLSYLYGRLDKRRQIRLVLFGSSALCWILGMASKEIALTLPGLIFVYEWFFFQNLDSVWLKRSAIYLVTGFAVLLAAVYLVYHYSPLNLVTGISQDRQYTALERFLTQGRVIFLYTSLLIYPHPSRLNLNHDISVSYSLFSPFTTFISFAGLVALLVGTILVAKRHRLVAFCVIWIFANLAIESLAGSIEPMFEHRFYLPSMLFFPPFVWFLLQYNRPRIVFSIIGVLIMVFSFWTYQRNALWNNPIAFWEYGLRKSPNHYRAHFNLGTSYLHAKLYDRAILAFQKALTLTPPYPTEIYTNMGATYLETGQHDLARQNLNRAVILNPNNYIAHDLLATLSQKDGNHVAALKHYQMAIRINPNYAASHHNLGILYTDMGELDNAVSAFHKAIILRPKLTEAYSSLGLARARQGRYDLAIPMLRKTIEMDYSNQEALFNLAKVYDLIDWHEMAAKTYKTLLEIDQKDVEAMHNLGMIYLKHLKNIEQATFYFKKALATDPDYDHAAVVRDTLSQIELKP
jgi:tetratricopeptide (TPR) repeat protein